MLLAKTLHGVAILALAGFGLGAGLGWPYFTGVGVGAAVIAWEHRLVKPGDLSRLDAAFFTANGALSVWLFAWTALDLWLRPGGALSG